MKKGRVISRNLNDCLVCEYIDLNGAKPEQINSSQLQPIKLNFKKKNTEVYAGDFVYYQLHEEETNHKEQTLNNQNNNLKLNQSKFGHQGYLLGVIEPKNHFFRIDSYGNQKIIARNITQLALILAAVPKPNFLSIDAALALCQLNQVKPVIIVNKSDLAESARTFQGIERYQDYGAEICYSSIYDSQSIENLKKIFINHTTLLFGLSGVGKSSIIQQFFGEKKIKTQFLVNKTQKGKHTTTQAQLYVSEKIELIDTAGLGNIAISYFDQKNLANLFVDFLPYLNDCKFRNCNHSKNQSGCGLTDAAMNGKIHLKRLKQYQLLYSEFCYKRDY